MSWNRRHTLAAALLLSLLFAAPGRCQTVTTTVDFEGLADGTLLAGQFPNMYFSNAVVLTAGVSLNEFEFPPRSGINVGSDRGGPMNIAFPTPANSVGGYFTYTVPVTMTAFDAHGHVLATANSQFATNEALSGAPGSAPNEFLQVVGPGIATLTITGAAGGSSFTLDDLVVVQPPITQGTITITQQNNPPAITSARNLGTFPFGMPVSAGLTASGGKPPYAWSASGLPAGITFSSGGTLAGMPAQPGSYQFTVIVTDSQPLSVSAQFNFSVFGITTSSLPGAAAYVAYSQTLAATGGAAPYTFSGSGLPSGIVVNSNGTVNGTTASAGTYQITIRAVDANGISTSTALSLIVSPPPPLVITSAPNLGTFAFGASIFASLTASGGAVPYAWSASGTLPAGITVTSHEVIFGITTNNGTIQGVPSQPGSYQFVITVTDQQPTSTSALVSFSVFGITTNSLPAALANAVYSQAVAATGGAAPYRFSGTGLPSGIVVNSDGTIKGSATTAGTYVITIQAVDANGVTTSAVLSLVVMNPGPLAVPSATLPAGVVAVPYSQSLTATGGIPPYSWGAVVGSLPSGLAVSSTGVVSGLPAALGTFTFTATATDSAGTSATGTISIRIVAPPVTLTTPSQLPLGMVNADYPIQLLSVSGGAPPYSFSATGTLPPGVSLSAIDGSIGGVATTAGSFTFMVTATDSAGNLGSVTLQITVRPSSSDLLLSSGSLLFSTVAGSSATPPAQVVRVQSSVAGTVQGYSVAVTPSVPWLSVNQGATSTPGLITVSLTSQAQQLGVSSISYQTTLTVTCMAPNACAGKAQDVLISLTVTSPPAQLEVLNNLLAFTTPAVSPQASTLNLNLQNAGGGTVGITSITSGATWAKVGMYPGALSAGPPVAVSITADPTGLSPGYYRTTLAIATFAGVTTIPVTFLITPNPSMVLSPAGQQFSIAAGGMPPTANNSVLVSVSGTSAVNWTAAVPPGIAWLTVSTPSGTSTNTSPGTINFVIDPVAVAALSPGTYYGTIRVSSDSVVNSPLDFQLVLNVLAANSPQTPVPVPEGLLFISSSAAAPPLQTVQVFSSAAGPATYQATASTTDGHSWLSVNPSTGTATPPAPGQSIITVNPSGLAAGIYRGGVSYAGTAAALRTVNVTLIIQNSSGSGISQGSVLHASAQGSCRASQLSPVPLDPANNFSRRAFHPVAIEIQLVDDCGNPVTDGQVNITFSNGDPPLSLALVSGPSGLYSGSWTPRGPSSQITVSSIASAPGLPTSTIQFSGAITPGSAPVLTPNGILNIFNAQTAGAVAAGTIIQIYGSNFAGQAIAATSVPLQTSLGGTSVTIGGIAAPLYYVSPGQINAQVPFELSPNQQYQVIVNANGALSTPAVLQLSTVSPGVAASSDGSAIATHLNGALVTESLPATPGELLELYATGMGATDNPAGTGLGSPSNPLARVLIFPTLMLNSEATTVLFAGLTPGLVGLYQVNFQVPIDAPNGDLTLTLSQNNVIANTAILPVHN